MLYLIILNNMANLKGCFSSLSDDWKTPDHIYNSFMAKGFVDPCPFQADFDGLKKEFYNVYIFCNLPYSQISKWVDWLIHQWLDNGCHFALLVPSRTDTKWFHKLLDLGVFVDFYKGRLHFNNSKNGAPFPSMLVRTYYEC